ncbi:GNAT family N-acetyltransferase [Schumannella sp. 10F1B-5-1]|uniref:GNAT family N-acetyltransferase n=1 Tax=Schumannella sp. 10F1B-5-1 TaxID=2590780 RepID=UPI001130164D|nr:GNAT family N-acetyltransferase [Schumannella sp. 10F1B-5-1]TPW70753.1 GNAT family N-acetyltransferase [Schumannella sp. 10F1B-5-1]
MSTARDFLALPADAVSREKLAAQGLDYRVLDTRDEVAFAAWVRADERGFHGPLGTPEQNAFARSAMGSRRTVGVWDAGIVRPDEPVATVNAWPAELTVPGRRTVDGWAISSVTVSPTHRRRGIARALLEGELRSAVALGLPLAMLTVSEASIYGRYGFGPAAGAADVSIDTSRAGWLGDEPTGRVDFIDPEEYPAIAAALHEAGRLDHPGEVPGWIQRWHQAAALAPGDSKRAATRAVQYREDGEVRAAAVFRVIENPSDFGRHRVEVARLDSTTASARLGLFRFLLSLDLVERVDADLLSVDEPLLWRLADQRAATVRVHDHQWLRILDVPAALEGRALAGAGRWRLEVTDPLGHASGSWLVESDAEGVAHVTADSGVDEVDTGAGAEAPTLRTDVAALSSAYLGGVAVGTLAAAGRMAGSDAEAVAIADRVLRSPVTPYLSIWY